MTGNDCLAFLIDDVKDDRIRREGEDRPRPFDRSEVYRVAEHLGIAPNELPCAAFFIQPTETRELLLFPLVDDIRLRNDGTPDLSAVFRAIASACRDCAEAPETKRLDLLRTRLEENRKTISSRPSKLQAWADSASSIHTVYAAAATIIASLVTGANVLPL